MTNEPTTTLAAPIGQQERIIFLDSLRGIAILGILLMNIPGFGIPYVAINDFSIQPQAINYKIWYVFGLGFLKAEARAFSPCCLVQE